MHTRHEVDAVEHRGETFDDPLATTDGGSRLSVHITVEVRVPLLGGKIEEIIAGQVRRLLEAETAFTVRWLGSR